MELDAFSVVEIQRTRTGAYLLTNDPATIRRCVVAAHVVALAQEPEGWAVAKGERSGDRDSSSLGHLLSPLTA
jgi:hypothetical protein